MAPEGHSPTLSTLDLQHGASIGRLPVPARLPGGKARALFQGGGWVAARMVSDGLMLFAAVLLAGGAAGASGLRPPDRLLTAVLPLMVVGLLALRGLYRRDWRMHMLDAGRHIISATSLAAMSSIALAAMLYPGSPPPAELGALAWLFSTALLTASRVGLGLAARQARVERLVGDPTLIVGAGQVGALLERRLMEQPELGLVPIGFVDPDPLPAEAVPNRQAPVLGEPDQLDEIVRRTGAKHVIVAFFAGPDSRLAPLIRRCEELGLSISVVPRLFESTNHRMAVEHVGGMPLCRLSRVDPKGWEFAAKHVFDRMAAATIIVLVSPILAAAAIAVRLSSPGPILFRQRRIGRDGHSFDILKFRSMRIVHPAARLQRAIAMSSDVAPGGVEGLDRRTRIGTFLRNSSIDELPQLFNVLKGDMSLVGPRPERPEFVELFGQDVYRYDDRHRVKSGITGWAQVHGLRGKTPLADRVEWDNYYIENWSLWLDLKILLMTFTAVLRGAE